ncbi:MAG: DUF2191 domain-containing protein [bacterium]|nr:DUF2191 domain-containing protein [bacterium]
MKTTVDIASNILTQAKDLAHKEETTLRQLVQEGLELVIRQRAARRSRVRPVTFGGKGLSAEFRGAGWSTIRDAAYRGRGS